MKGLIRALFEEPGLLDEITPEMEEDGNGFTVISYMTEIWRRGIKPEPKDVLNELKTAGEHAAVKHLRERLQDELEFSRDYAVQMLKEDYGHRKLFTMLNEGLRRNNTDSVSDVLRFIDEETRTVAVGSKPKNMDQAVQDTMAHLQRIHDGTQPATWKTGHKRHDLEIGFAERMLVMIAGQQKQGKTRIMVNYMMRLLRHNKGLSADFFTFEMHTTEVIICLIAHITGISTSVIKGRTRKPTPDEWKHIVNANGMVKELPITWHDTKMSIDGIRRQVDRNMTEKHMVVIDNLGLIRNERNLDELRHDNEVASSLVDMRDKTGALIFLLHHLSKESESHYNKKDGFEPNTKHLRGSNKWADCLNSLILVHRPAAYPELQESFSSEKWTQLQDEMLIKVPITREGSPTRFMMKHKLECCQFSEKDDGDAEAA
jgi:replicative DNA helicase